MGPTVYLDLQGLNPLRVEGTRGETKVGQLDMTSPIDEEVLQKLSSAMRTHDLDGQDLLRV